MFRDFYRMADELHRAIRPEWRMHYALNQWEESWHELCQAVGELSMPTFRATGKMSMLIEEYNAVDRI